LEELLDVYFVDDAASYLKGTEINLKNAFGVLKSFCLATSSKINWNKSTTIWASTNPKTILWGEDVGLV